MASHERSNGLEASKTGDGIKGIRTTNLFKVINFELYAKPVSNLFVVLFV